MDYAFDSSNATYVFPRNHTSIDYWTFWYFFSGTLKYKFHVGTDASKITICRATIQNWAMAPFDLSNLMFCFQYFFPSWNMLSSGSFQLSSHRTCMFWNWRSKYYFVLTDIDSASFQVVIRLKNICVQGCRRDVLVEIFRFASATAGHQTWHRPPGLM